MTRRCASWMLLTVGLCGVWCDRSALAAETYQLRYKFQAGQIVHYEVSHDGEITTQVSDVSETTKNLSRSRKHFRVLSVTPDGAGDLELTIDWVRLEAKYGDEAAVVYQSDDEALRPKQYEQVHKVVGKPQATIRFSPLGKVIEVTKSTPSTGASRSNPDASPESYMVPLPEQAIAVGDSWKERFEIEIVTQDKLPLRVSMLRTYKLAAVNGNDATIEFRTSILTPIEDPALSAQLIQRETSGKLTFDLTAGLITGRSSSVDRTVVNPFGPKTSLRAAGTYSEKTIPAAAIAAEPKPATVTK